MAYARDRFGSGAVETRMSRTFASLLIALALSGCSAVDTLDFYWQGAAGQMDLITRARPIPEVIELIRKHFPLNDNLYRTILTRDDYYPLYFGAKRFVGIIYEMNVEHSPLMVVLS